MKRMSTLTIVALLILSSLASAQPGGRGPGGRGPGGFGRMQGSSAMLLGMPEVRTELATSEDQNKQLDDLVEKSREELRGTFGNPQEFQKLSADERQKSMEESRKKMEAAGKQLDEKVGKILDAKQVGRLRQLQLQREGALSLGRPEAAKQLGLSDEQQQKIGKIAEDARPGGGGGDFQNLSREERQQRFTKMQEQRTKAESDAQAVLTPEQKTKWTELQGATFKFPEGPGAGGPGGGGRRRDRGKGNN